MNDPAKKIGHALELLERSITNLETTRPAWVDEIMNAVEQVRVVAVETAKDLKQLREHVMPTINEHGETIRKLEEETFMRLGEHGSNGNGNAE